MVCQSKAMTDSDFQFDFGWCSILYLDLLRDFPFELEWYIVWYLRVVEIDGGFQSV